MADTIFALATPHGKSGVALIRMSGPQALDALKTLTQDSEAPIRGAAFRPFMDPNSGDVIDYGIAVYYQGPKSFTGEDVVELQVHGSLAVIDEMLKILAQLKNCRMAEPGEFTRRAFENEKMDLTEAEAVADLIDAETQAQKAQALEQMSGALSALYQGWAAELTKSLAYVEAVIDFPDEDVPDDEIVKARPAIETITAEIADHLNDNRRGERLRHGIHVAVIGAPNAGKSSLVNALAQRDVAIVSDMAGTTRDVIEVHLDLGGYPVILADTAGLRPDQLSEKGQDGIESEGIRRALQRAQEADIKLLLFDASAGELDPHTEALIDDDAITVISKTDCHPEGALRLKDLLASEGSFANAQDDIISISVTTRENIPALLEELTERVGQVFSVSRETPSLTRARHRSALEESQDHLQNALQETTPELMAESLRLAVRSLGRITGRVDVEDLLDVIFKDFCIGK